MNKVIIPGSFDPITKGHMDIIEQASQLFDKVVVAVMQNPLKDNGFFTIEERVQLIKEIYDELSKVKVIVGTGALVDVALDNNCSIIVRGVRGVRDFEYEMGLAQVNKDISQGKVNTILLFASPEFQNISSTIVKEVFRLDKDISKYVDGVVKKSMLLKRRNF